MIAPQKEVRINPAISEKLEVLLGSEDQNRLRGDFHNSNVLVLTAIMASEFLTKPDEAIEKDLCLVASLVILKKGNILEEVDDRTPTIFSSHRLCLHPLFKEAFIAFMPNQILKKKAAEFIEVNSTI